MSIQREDIDAKLTSSQRQRLVFLRQAGLFYYDHVDELEDDEETSILRSLNLNDTFWWASAYSEQVEDSEIDTLYTLFQDYGWCGVVYWAAKKGNITAEFNHVTRMIQFVENEERIKAAAGSSSAYAYSKETYTLGKTI